MILSDHYRKSSLTKSNEINNLRGPSTNIPLCVGYVCVLHGWLYAMCLMAGHNGLSVTQHQLKEMEENRERRGRRGGERKRSVGSNEMERWGSSSISV